MRCCAITVGTTDMSGNRLRVETRAMQAAIAVLALLPVGAGVAGIVLGPSFLGVEEPWPVDLDSHLRFLSGVFLVVGLGWWSCVPGLPHKGRRLRLLALMTFAGGLARLASLGISGVPGAGHIVGLAMELVVVPLLVLWHGRLARAWRDSADKTTGGDVA
jgi:hypothetical protein